jgi:N-sulfoglucosamine sulfohydrolase
LLEKTQVHHTYVFAETSMEPHFWYNYVPSRSVITRDGFQYIKNYHPGLRFITHIDKVERNEFYFDSWVAKAIIDTNARFLLNRYSYRAPQELFNLNTDRESFKNLAEDPACQSQLKKLSAFLEQELKRQGETDAMIQEGTLPKFFDRSYTIAQNGSAMDLSFNPKLWNPEKLHITGYLEGIDKGGIICSYFNNFLLFAYQGRIGLQLADGTIRESALLDDTKGHLWLQLTTTGDLLIQFNNRAVVTASINKNLTQIGSGFVTCGILQGQELKGRLQTFRGQIGDLRFSMNELAGTP